jgi:hypothetical protein
LRQSLLQQLVVSFRCLQLASDFLCGLCFCSFAGNLLGSMPLINLVLGLGVFVFQVTIDSQTLFWGLE